MPTTRRLPLLLTTLPLLVLGAAACGSDDTGVGSASGTETTSTTAGSSTTAATSSGSGPTIKSFVFGNLEVTAGSEVTVTNEDNQAHTFTANDGTFDTDTIGAGSTGTFTAPSEPGSYDVHCNIHSSMKGTLSVT